MAGPQTTREALITELLGDIDGLLKKFDTISKELPKTGEEAAERIENAILRGCGKIEESSDNGLRKLNFEYHNQILKMQEVKSDIQLSADIVRGTSAKFLLLSIIIAIVFGFMGGIAAQWLI